MFLRPPSAPALLHLPRSLASRPGPPPSNRCRSGRASFVAPMDDDGGRAD